jgi:hypothetical protein
VLSFFHGRHVLQGVAFFFFYFVFADLISFVILAPDYSCFAEVKSYGRIDASKSDNDAFVHVVVIRFSEDAAMEFAPLIGPKTVFDKPDQATPIKVKLEECPFTYPGNALFVNMDALDRLRSDLQIPTETLNVADLCAFITAATSPKGFEPFREPPPASKLKCSCYPFIVVVLRCPLLDRRFVRQRTDEEAINKQVGYYLVGNQFEKANMLSMLVSYAEGVKMKLLLCRVALEVR